MNTPPPVSTTLLRWLVVFAILTAAVILATAIAVMRPTPVEATGERTDGTASWFGPGHGVATQWCTWTLRHSEGCGMLAVQSHATGITVIVPVVDWCECYRGTDRERIVDLQLDVVAALGLDPADGLFQVTTWRVTEGASSATMAPTPAPALLPNTATEPWYAIPLSVIAGAAVGAAIVLVVGWVIARHDR